MSTSDNIVPIELVLTWPFAIALLFTIDHRRRTPVGFLTYAYIADFFINHWFGGLVHALPWKPFLDSSNTVLGFEEATWALGSFVLGAILARVPAKAYAVDHPAALRGQWTALELGERLALAYLAAGALFWIASFTQLSEVPSLSAVIGGGKNQALFGICLKCWIAWHRHQFQRFSAWLFAALAFPAITILFQGFLGYGISAVVIVLSFVAMFYRPRWRLAVGALAAAYAGLSLWVAYAEHRETIRNTVWGQQQLGDRVAAVEDMLAAVEPFDFTDLRHLAFVDMRLNQNWLVGAAVEYTPSIQPYAYGETVYQALLALVPRAIWPDKPVKAGSMGLVTEHTGISFAEGTSVGLGQVLEFYINFGRAGVIIGFLILGLVMRSIDYRLRRCLHAADWNRAAIWFLTGAGALQVGGSLVEVTASMAGGAVSAWAVSTLTGLWKTGVPRSAPARAPLPLTRRGN